MLSRKVRSDDKWSLQTPVIKPGVNWRTRTRPLVNTKSEQAPRHRGYITGCSIHLNRAEKTPDQNISVPFRSAHNVKSISTNSLSVKIPASGDYRGMSVNKDSKCHCCSDCNVSRLRLPGIPQEFWFVQLLFTEQLSFWLLSTQAYNKYISPKIE